MRWGLAAGSRLQNYRNHTTAKSQFKSCCTKQQLGSAAGVVDVDSVGLGRPLWLFSSPGIAVMVMSLERRLEISTRQAELDSCKSELKERLEGRLDRQYYVRYIAKGNIANLLNSSFARSIGSLYSPSQRAPIKIHLQNKVAAIFLRGRPRGWFCCSSSSCTPWCGLRFLYVR